MVWNTLAELYRDSEAYVALTGSLPTLDQLVAFTSTDACSIARSTPSRDNDGMRPAYQKPEEN